MQINAVVLTANLTRDPELKSLPSGTSVCDLGIAVNERVKKGDEWTDQVSYFDVAVWGAQGETCAKYLSKGSPVAVQGRLRQERWENDAGEKRSKVKIVAQTVQFLSTKGDGESGGESSSTGDSGDNLPF